MYKLLLSAINKPNKNLRKYSKGCKKKIGTLSLLVIKKLHHHLN